MYSLIVYTSMIGIINETMITYRHSRYVTICISIGYVYMLYMYIGITYNYTAYCTYLYIVVYVIVWCVVCMVGVCRWW